MVAAGTIDGCEDKDISICDVAADLALVRELGGYFPMDKDSSAVKIYVKASNTKF